MATFREAGIPFRRSGEPSRRCQARRQTGRYFRGDSADCYLPPLKYLVKEQVVFAISADMSEKLRGHCEKLPQESWVEIQDREREVVHRSMKGELGAGGLPCHKFGANAAWFRIHALTYNLLALLKRRALTARYLDARPKRPRFEVLAMPGRLTFHQRQLSVSLSCDSPRVEELGAPRGRLLECSRTLQLGE